MGQSMRILHIPNYYPPNYGGIENICEYCVRAFGENPDAKQKVLCMNKNKNTTQIDIIGGVEVVRCASPVQISSQSVSKEFPGQLNRLMREFKPDVVILHWPNPFTASFLMQHADKEFRFILYWHSDIVKQKVLGKVFGRVADNAARRADVIVATSPNYVAKSEILTKYSNKVVVVPNCIDEKRLHPDETAARRAEEIKEENQGKVICFTFGREVPYKGFEYLYKAKPFFNSNITLIHGKNLSQEELIAHLMACDIFCFPSITKNEAFGLALAEGMYFGHPAVTFTIPGSGVNYVSLDGITGIECPNGDSKAYADAVNKLAEDEKLREKLGQQAAQRVRENFLYEQYKEAICDRRIIPDTADDGNTEVCAEDG